MDIVFLDFDGVLNSEDWSATAADAPEGEGYWGPSSLDERAVRRLNGLVAPGVHFVVSSTWRQVHDREALESLLKSKGFSGTILDVTPRMHRTPDGFLPVRGHEIQAWLDTHAVRAFVTLDDDSDMAHLLPHLVQTDPKLGLRDEDVARAREMLTTAS